ncbi:unnamed protein product [Citrullus colocynthis]|uniref:Small auxin up regulated protein n=1 Tax=Citrullus colocynthis TaxID=252529 RepID=A0ABP0Z7B1_9ROSI
MGIRLLSLVPHAKQILKIQSGFTKNQLDVPKGHVAVYVGEIQRKRTIYHSKSFIDPSVQSNLDMGFRIPSILFSAKQIFKTQSISGRCQSSVPKGHIAVYVGEIQRTRFLVPISYLNHPSFLDLLRRAEEEFGFNHPTGGLTIPCKEEAFIDVTSRMHISWKLENKAWL